MATMAEAIPFNDDCLVPLKGILAIMRTCPELFVGKEIWFEQTEEVSGFNIVKFKKGETVKWEIGDGDYIYVEFSIPNEDNRDLMFNPYGRSFNLYLDDSPKHGENSSPGLVLKQVAKEQQNQITVFLEAQ